MRLKTNNGRLFVWLVALLIFFMISSPVLGADGPLSVIRSGTDKALEILRDREPDGNLNLRARRGEILTIVDKYFNFHEMAKRALGRPWKDQTPEKRQQFVDLFKELLFNTYVDQVEKYTAGNERVVYDEQQIDQGYALVKTRVLGYKNTDVPVEYRLTFENGQWKVYDVVIAGISLVSNYRSQFRSILANNSFNDLLDMMKRKVDSQSSFS